MFFTKQITFKKYLFVEVDSIVKLNSEKLLRVYELMRSEYKAKSLIVSDWQEISRFWGYLELRLDNPVRELKTRRSKWIIMKY